MARRVLTQLDMRSFFVPPLLDNLEFKHSSTTLKSSNHIYSSLFLVNKEEN